MARSLGYNLGMTKDKYSAVWVSHSSISDFLACPRAYYLKNIWRNPKTNHKMQPTNPSLALGSAVHEVVESLSVLPTNARFTEPLPQKLERVWKKYSGKLGGFTQEDTEYRFKQRALKMLTNITQNPGPLNNLAVKIQMDLPHYWISEADNIILCGKIDWLEYIKEKDGVHIIDFKTGVGKQEEGSLQLPIYCLLTANCQKWPILKASYWYLEQEEGLVEKKLPKLEEAKEKVMEIAKKMKLARQLEHFKCKTDGCRVCKPLEKVVRGEAELVGVNDFGQDIYLLPEVKEEAAEAAIL